MRTLWSKYYSDCHAVCFVLDSTDRNSDRISDCWKTFDQIISDRRIEGVPVLVLANKMDQENAMPIESIKEAFNKHVALHNVSEATVMPVSALTGWVPSVLIRLTVADDHVSAWAGRALPKLSIGY